MQKRVYILFFVICSIFASAQSTITYNCILRSNAQKDTMCDGKVIPIFGITNTLAAPAKIPAKILYCNEGDSVVLYTKSISQNEHHTIHLHGLDVDTRNDGDPSTSFWLSHLQDTTYSFKATHAGTYIYHCHAADVIHVQMGMYGLIVVRAAGGAKNVWTGGPSYNKDYKWLMSEIDSVWHFHEPIHDTLMDTVNVPKYVPNYFLINGKCGNELNNDDSINIKGAQGEKILMRLANIGYLTNRVIFPSWLNAQILDSDGRPLPNAIVNDTTYIMPGERFGVMLQSTIQAIGTVTVDYVDMNTGLIVFTNPVPVTINDFIGLKEQNKRSDRVSIFPNPTDKYLVVKSDLEMESSFLKIYNSIGQLVLTSEFNKEIKLDVSSFSKGLYSIVLFDKTGNHTAKNFIKVD